MIACAAAEIQKPPSGRGSGGGLKTVNYLWTSCAELNVIGI
jgi:hypothetical protein